MRLKVIVLWIKGDWGEYANSFGFAGWRDALRPCFLRNVFGDGLQVSLGVGMVASFWRANKCDDYDEA
eukprot:7885805-Lingulodinium_polyedra.AAC.1